MSIAGFKARNHPRYQAAATDEIDDRETTRSVFDPLHERFRFTVDVAAAAHNTKLPRYYDLDRNGLLQSWDGERVWCNPPYSNIRPWVEKAWVERAELVVMLLPANRTEQKWWQDLIEPHLRAKQPDFACEFLPDLVRFIRKGQTRVEPNDRPPFGCCLLIWGDNPDPAPSAQPGLFERAL